ncbi:MAG: HAD family hydrolase [Acutalibacteraceae bacterium]
MERYQAINAPLWKMMERREITKEALVVRRFRELFEELGITGIDPAQYNADYLNNLALCTRTIDGAEELRRFIHENGVLIIATNGVSATQHRRIAASGLEPWLDKVVVSDDAGARSPIPGILSVPLR